MYKLWKWDAQVCWNPEGDGGGAGSMRPAPAGKADFDDLPAEPEQNQQGDPSGIRFIEEAFDQVNDLEQTQEVVDQTQQQRRPIEQRPQQPRYPQPVQVGPRRQQLPAQAITDPQEQLQQQRQEDLQHQQQQQPSAEELQQQQAALRARSDPFGVQADMLQEQEQAYVQALAEQVYPISAQDMDAFLSGDSTKVSQALARVHVNAVGSVMKVVSQQLPMMMGHYIKFYQAARDREDRFYNNNKFLDRTQHGQLVADIARTYRRMYPKASDDQIDKAVGIMAAAALNIPVPAGHMQTAGRGVSQQTHQTAEGVRTPGKVVRQTGGAYNPAGANGVGGAPRTPELGMWGEIEEIIRADERGAFDR